MAMTTNNSMSVKALVDDPPGILGRVKPCRLFRVHPERGSVKDSLCALSLPKWETVVEFLCGGKLSYFQPSSCFIQGWLRCSVPGSAGARQIWMKRPAPSEVSSVLPSVEKVVRRTRAGCWYDATSRRVARFHNFTH